MDYSKHHPAFTERYRCRSEATCGVWLEREHTPTSGGNSLAQMDLKHSAWDRLDKLLFRPLEKREFDAESLLRIRMCAVAYLFCFIPLTSFRLLISQVALLALFQIAFIDWLLHFGLIYVAITSSWVCSIVCYFLARTRWYQEAVTLFFAVVLVTTFMTSFFLIFVGKSLDPDGDDLGRESAIRGVYVIFVISTFTNFLLVVLVRRRELVLGYFALSVCAVTFITVAAWQFTGLLLPELSTLFAAQAGVLVVTGVALDFARRLYLKEARDRKIYDSIRKELEKDIKYEYCVKDANEKVIFASNANQGLTLQDGPVQVVFLASEDDDLSLKMIKSRISSDQEHDLDQDQDQVQDHEPVALTAEDATSIGGSMTFSNFSLAS